MKTSPDCKDFILTALREMRPKLANLQAGAKSGVSLKRVWALTSTFYSEEEFRESLQKLHSEGVLIIIWNIGRGVKDQPYHIQHDEIMEEIPPAMPLDSDRWRKEVNGNSIIPYIAGTRAWEYDSVHEVKLYIKADGLPQKVSRLLGDKPNKRALEIMAKCMEQK